MTEIPDGRGMERGRYCKGMLPDEFVAGGMNGEQMLR